VEGTGELDKQRKITDQRVTSTRADHVFGQKFSCGCEGAYSKIFVIAPQKIGAVAFPFAEKGRDGAAASPIF
jgi:hypothetical protein